ncbi:MAG: AMP-binding protein, partial [Myxococcota bacterium]
MTGTRADTIPARLMNQAKLRPTEPAYFVRKNNTWNATDWQTYTAEVRRAAKAFIAMGLEPGDKVAMLGFNRPEWVIFYLAAMSIGAAGVGIYSTCSTEEVQYIANHAEAKSILVESVEQWEKIAAELDNLPHLEHVITMKGVPAIEHAKVHTWTEFEGRGDGVADSDLDKHIDALKPEELAGLIYTSGTTGPPKGVMLSHHNVAWTADTLLALSEISNHDSLLSYLPLSHIAEQMLTVHGAVTAGFSVYYAESIDKIADNIREVEPTFLFGVPRIWEKYYTAVSSRLATATGARKVLVDWARKVGSRASDRRNRGQSLGPLLAAQYGLASYLVFNKLKKALGLADARMCVSGAAPIARELLEFFASLDIIICEVYGQSEVCGPTSLNFAGK